MLWTHPMEMPAFNQIVLSHMILLVSDIIKAVAIIKAAVAIITKVVVAVIIVHTIPGEAVPVTDATEDLSQSQSSWWHHHWSWSHKRCQSHAARADLDHHEEDTVVIPIQSIQIANVPGMLRGLPGRNDTELIEAVKCSHQLLKLSHKASYKSSCQNC